MDTEATTGSMMKIACLYDTYTSMEEEDDDTDESKATFGSAQHRKQRKKKLHYTFTMLTRSPNTDNFFHDRIPVILPTKEMEDEWLDTVKYNGKEVISRFLTLYNYNYFDEPVSTCANAKTELEEKNDLNEASGLLSTF